MRYFKIKKLTGRLKKMKRKSKEERKAYIIQVATKLISEKGFHKTSMQEIADNAGINKATIYTLFKDKNDLFVSLVEYWFELMLSEVREECFECDNSVEKLGFIIDRSFEKIIKDAKYMGIFHNIWAEANNDLRLRGKIRGIWNNSVSFIKDIIRAGIEKKEIKNINSETISLIIGGFFHILSVQILFKNELNPLSIDIFKQDFKEILFNGIRNF